MSWAMYLKSNKRRRGSIPRYQGMRRSRQWSVPASLAITFLSLLLIASILIFYTITWVVLTFKDWVLHGKGQRRSSRLELLPMAVPTRIAERSISASTTFSESPFTSQVESFTLQQNGNSQSIVLRRTPQPGNGITTSADFLEFG